MSKKRFSSNFYEEDGRTIPDNGNELTQNEVVDLLNEQQVTINQLKEENEQLKEELNNLKKDETMLYHYYTLARYGGD